MELPCMQVQLEVPYQEGVTEDDVRLMAALKLFETRTLPLGKAATVAGLSYRQFFDLLVSDYDIPVVECDEEYLEEDIENAGKFMQPVDNI